jgi:hypothetical protein
VYAKTSLESRRTPDAIHVDQFDVVDRDGRITEDLRRKEQDILERIIHGAEKGHYFMVFGCKVLLPLLSPCIAHLSSLS